MKDAIDMKRDIISNFTTISLTTNKMNKLLKNIINLPKLTQEKIENLTDPLTIIRNWAVETDPSNK